MKPGRVAKQIFRPVFDFFGAPQMSSGVLIWAIIYLTHKVKTGILTENKKGKRL
jgi:hypothetical protein